MFFNRQADGPSRRPRRSHRPVLEMLDARKLLSGNGLLTGVAPPVDGVVHHQDHQSKPDGADSAPSSAAGPDRVISNIAYTHTGSTLEKLDLYLPAGTPPPGGWPIILAFPGGGWRWASRQQYGQEVSVLTSYGFAVAGVDVAYASDNVGGTPGWPANLQDAEDAVRWVDSHAAVLHLNSAKIVAMGDSAGANIALLLGTYPDVSVADNSPPPATGAPASHVAAVVDFYGPTDLTSLYNESRPNALPYLETDLGGTPTQVPGRYEASSPLTYVNKSDPPMLIVQGLEDHTVLPSQSLELDAALTKAGVSHELVTIPWAEHGFGLNLVGYDLTGTVATFLDAALGEKGSTAHPAPVGPTMPTSLAK
jgi:acetyl esterase/lipase